MSSVPFTVTADDLVGLRLAKRSVTLAGHRTSVSLEDAFWAVLQREALARAISLNALVMAVDAERGDASLSSALRVYALNAVTSGGSAPDPGL